MAQSAEGGGLYLGSFVGYGWIENRFTDVDGFIGWGKGNDTPDGFDWGASAGFGKGYQVDFDGDGNSDILRLEQGDWALELGKNGKPKPVKQTKRG